MMRSALLAMTVFSGLAVAQGDVSYGETHRLKVSVEGTLRKVGFFLPRGIGKRDVVPIVVAIPDGSGSSGKAFKEIGQFEQMAYEHHFAVLSVDVATSSNEGWHPKDAIAMERDVEAVVSALDAAKKKAKELGITLDPSATAVRGHSGACYLALWIGVRRPDLFFVVSLNGFPKWYPEFLEFKGERNPNQRIHVYRGERDHVRVRRETDKAIEAIKAAGYVRMETADVKAMAHESRPDVFVKWYGSLLKSTAKARKDAARISAEAEKLAAALKAGKAGTIGKIVKLAEKEKKSGFGKSAAALLAQVQSAAEARVQAADDLAANNQFMEAADAYKKIGKEFNGLEIAKSARTTRKKLMKSDDYKAMELLIKARAYRKKGNEEKASAILVQITEKYPETIAAEQAEQMLKG
ncbi:MAG: hypothetical protein ACYTGZ_19825 [Planctomycetota bacterium]|jgi:predicted esterase